MNQEAILEKLSVHDRKLDKFEMGIEHLTESLTTLSNNVGTSNRKMEDFTAVISQQNLLMERYSSLDIELKESFSRVYGRIEHLEGEHNTNGCSALKQQVAMRGQYDERHKVINHRLDDLENSQKWLIRTIGVMLLAGVAKVVFNVG